MAYKKLYFGGHNSGEYGFYINSDTYLNAPAIDYTEYQIPGRNGALVQYNNRLNNIIRKFALFTPAFNDGLFAKFKHDLYQTRGYMRIESDYAPDVYQYGYLAEELTAAPFLTGSNLQATVDVYFSCKPQKYYKTNQTATSDEPTSTRIDGILPRNHPIIQRFFATIPAGDIPNDEAFLLYLANGSNNTAAVTALTATIAGYSGFMAAGFIAVSIDNQYTFDSLISYTTTGSISDSESHTPGVASNVYIIVPAETSGTMTSTVTRGTTYSRSEILAPLLTVYRDNTVQGVEYKLSAQGNTDYRHNEIPTSVFVRGYMSETGETTFTGVVSVYGDEMHDFITNNQAATLINTVIEVDSATLQAAVTYNGKKYNINEFTSISGMIDGRADTVEFFMYNTTALSFDAAYIELEPRWWTI